MGAGVEEALAVEADDREAEEPAEAGDQGELRNAECGEEWWKIRLYWG
jgi:hypothetical protein